VEEGQPKLTSLLDILVNPKPVCHVSSAPSAAGSDSRSTPNVANNHSVAVMSARQCPCNNRMIRDQNLNAKDPGMNLVEANSKETEARVPTGQTVPLNYAFPARKPVSSRPPRRLCALHNKMGPWEKGSPDNVPPLKMAGTASADAQSRTLLITSTQIYEDDNTHPWVSLKRQVIPPFPGPASVDSLSNHVQKPYHKDQTLLANNSAHHERNPPLPDNSAENTHLSSGIQGCGNERHLGQLVSKHAYHRHTGDLVPAAQSQAVHSAEVVVLGLAAVHHHGEKVLAGGTVDNWVEALLREKGQKVRELPPEQIDISRRKVKMRHYWSSEGEELIDHSAVDLVCIERSATIKGRRTSPEAPTMFGSESFAERSDIKGLHLAERTTLRRSGKICRRIMRPLVRRLKIILGRCCSLKHCRWFGWSTSAVGYAVCRSVHQTGL
jgi:hypothetical protein